MVVACTRMHVQRIHMHMHQALGWCLGPDAGMSCMCNQQQSGR